MRAAIFDLDGTLADSLPDIVGALNVTLGQMGVAPFAVGEGAAMVGAGARRLVSRALAARKVVADEALLTATFKRFVDNYDQAACVHTRLYPGALQALERLKAEGWDLGICTNKPQSTADLVVDGLGVRSLFGSIVGGREGVPLKPAGDMVVRVLTDLGVTARHAVMIGDSKADVGAARVVGLPVVLFTHGYTGGEPVSGLGADHIIDHFSQLAGALGAVCAA
jgi:phosphoglycolate phosphatase